MASRTSVYGLHFRDGAKEHRMSSVLASAGGEGRSGGVHSVPAGLSDEDRAAIEAAMAEFAAEDASHSSAGL